MARPKKPRPPSSPSTGTRITFYGFPAYIGALKGPTHCEWWSDDPNSLNWSTSALIPTDLTKTPSAARTGVIPIADIQCDDHRTDGGLTGIGPRFPQGTMVGAIWLRDTYWNSLGANQPKRASSDGYDYELTAHVYLDGPLKGRRFHGVHARLTDVHGPLTRVEIWHPVRSRVVGERPLGSFWLDLAQVAHPIEPGGTQLDPTHPEGALFLDEPTARQISLWYPKLPPWAGGEFL